MHRIIYSSPNKIEWDAQSAFKITNYYTEKEECMIFCYLKQYVHNGTLKLCSFCFDSEAAGKKDLQLCFNLNPEHSTDFILMEFGIDGINSAVLVSPENKSAENLSSDMFSYRAFKTNDQQGYYWCGEISVSKEFIRQYFDTELKEQSIILLNFYKIFDGIKDYGCLFPDGNSNISCKGETMQEFVILNY
ncbi:MAG: hypothetical protein IJW74_00700 [Oscillospiraceae bacterium]|nr:hypothetical protein [Oscillospiraceae bacterium]